MSEQNSTSDRFFVSVSVSDFDDVEALHDRIDELLPTIETTLTEELPAETVTTMLYDAPIYAGLGDHCPECGSHLRISPPELDSSNGVHAVASCEECDWHGLAVYRLIDLLTDYSESAVSQGLTSPLYLSYS